eukprot:2899403-Pleurochrysis_carterae.AAC.1
MHTDNAGDLTFATDSGLPPPKRHTPNNHIATCPQAERRMRETMAHNGQRHPCQTSHVKASNVVLV